MKTAFAPWASWLQGHLLQLQLLHLAGKHSLRRLRAAGAVRLGTEKLKRITVIRGSEQQCRLVAFIIKGGICCFLLQNVLFTSVESILFWKKKKIKQAGKFL
jgi:hypothetical protein